MWMVTFVFILCEPGARMINQFNLLSGELHRCEWFLLPIDMQRMYMIFLSDTQNPTKMRSYANIACERETSKQVSIMECECTLYIVHSNL